MIRNYFVAAFRNLRKNRGFSILNISGLAVGIACATLILLWTEDEVTYDHGVPEHDRIARVMQTTMDHGTARGPFNAAPGPLGPAIRAEITGVMNVARTNNSSELEQTFGNGDKVIKKQGNFADPSLIPMLSLKFVYGAAAHAFDQIHSVILSQQFAAELFGAGVDPVGRQLQVEHKNNFVVTGVFEDLPYNSSIRFSWLSPYANFESMMPWAKSWNANGLATYVQLEPKADPAAVGRQLAHFIAKKAPGPGSANIVCWLFPMNSWHLYWSFTNGYPDGKGDIRYVRLFFLIALIILVIACINFMNLSTAKSAERAKEVGVRKVMGAGRDKLISQFIGESLVMSFVSLVVAVGIAHFALGPFNQLVGKQLTIDLFKPVHLAVLLGIGLVTGLLAGSYPAFYLSSFSPISVLNTVRLRAGNWAAFVRKGLVILQFTISILLIICTTIVYQQVGFARTRDWGFNQNRLLSMDVEGNIQPHYDAIRADLLRTGIVENTALSMDNITSTGWWSSDGYTWPDKPEAEAHRDIENEQVTASYFATEGMRIVAGRGFRDDSHADDNNVVINESMAKLMGSHGQPGNIITADRPLTIIGVVHDFVFNNGFVANTSPMVIYNRPTNADYMTLRLKMGVDLGAAMVKVGDVMQRDNPGYPFRFQFLDEQLDQLFKTEMLMGQLSAIFTALAIFISCLGLFGLAAYSASRRSKEIGIRKVLGASTQGLAALLSRDFVKWVLLSCVVAFPLGWWLMKSWLQDYAYRTPIHWWVFGLAGVSALVIALVTVSVQAVRAAVANPVRSLRSQ